MLGRGRASDVDHSVHVVTCCYAGGRKTLVTVLDVLGFRPQDGQIWLSRVHSISESFHLEDTANVIGIDKPAATCDRKVIGI